MQKEAVEFVFDSYTFSSEKKEAIFNYIVNFSDGRHLSFCERIIFIEEVNVKKISKDLIERTLFNLHIMLGISYYKLYCPPKIKVNQFLSKEEADFWNIIYKKGLGEFYFRNGIDPNTFPCFPFFIGNENLPIRIAKNFKHLLFFGGGKDSIVAAELFKSQKLELDIFTIETQRTYENINEVVRVLGLNSLKVKRFIDKKVFDNKYRKYNGHIPISAVYSFIGLLYAVLYGYSYLVTANEYSSNFGNIKYKGENINHQWSKSSEFENLFNNYIKRFITPDILYFSILRPFYEIRIVEMFSKYKKYFSVFSSCNNGFKIAGHQEKLWCGECAKCVFIFILLSAFLSKKELIKIFNRNLYDNENLLPIFKDVLGIGKMKPFDCVGTSEESIVAFLKAVKKFKNSCIVKKIYPIFKNKKILNSNVFKAMNAENIPDYLKLLGMKNVAIIGYGIEGKITKKYIENNFSSLKVSILDEKNNKNYLNTQKYFDFGIKTPGIPKKLIKIPYTTATNIFFSKIHNKIIGVTGSKGKSTTASLIYSILKEAGKKTVLVGNIGKPMVEVLLKPVNSETIFVLELSSYQLSDIRFSPNIAVLTSLFPEHMNYHLSKEAYYFAKKNIVNFQSAEDVFIYNPKISKIYLWLKNLKSKAVPMIPNIPFDQNGIKLIGEHNKNNIKEAITVARFFNISDSVSEKAIKKFKGLPHRLEFVGKFKGITFYDDAISTTPESTIMAIKSLPNIETIFLGGEDRGYDFSQLKKIIIQYKIKNIVLFPNSGVRIFKKNDKLNIFMTKSMAQAVRFAYNNTSIGKTCLLSCASPSYSLWKNFEEKGNVFQYYVKKYSKK